MIQKAKKGATPPPKGKSISSSKRPSKVDKGGDRPLSASEKVQAYVKSVSVNPRYKGKVQVRLAKDYKTPFNLRRPTGLLSLDLALGGGFPAGGCSQVYGARSSGKTHICFCVAGQIQKHYGNNSVILIAMSEMRSDVGFARMSGVCVRYSDYEIEEYDKIRKNKGLPPFTSEERADLQKQIGEVIFTGGNTGGDVLDGTLEALDRMGNVCQLVIVDSLGSLLTPDQEAKSVSDKHYGGSSGLLTIWQNKLQPKFVNDLPDGTMLETTILGINQVRALIGSPMPNSTRPAAGAKSWEHAQLTNVELKTSEPLWADTKHNEQSGKVIKWGVKKGKAGTHDGAKGEFDWYYFPHHDPVFWKDVVENSVSYGADKISDLINVCKKLGVIEMGGPWRYIKDDAGNLLVRTQGDEPLVERVLEDPELEARLRESCLKSSGLTVRYK